MQRRDEDSRGMRGAEDENERPHARPTAVLQYTLGNNVDFRKEIIAFLLSEARLH